MCPLYDIKNLETGEIEEKMMSIKEYEQYKKDFPNHQQVFTDMKFVDSVRLGIRKPPRDFQEGIIGRMQRSIPGNRIRSSWDT